MGKNAAYAAQYAEEAKEQMRMYGIPASVILAQAILESSNGQSQLSRECNNHFGIKDFDAYVEAQEQVGEDFKNELEFYRKAFINMASAGKFSSDRTIEEYAKEIWNIESITSREV